MASQRRTTSPRFHPSPGVEMAWKLPLATAIAAPMPAASAAAPRLTSSTVVPAAAQPGMRTANVKTLPGRSGVIEMLTARPALTDTHLRSGCPEQRGAKAGLRAVHGRSGPLCKRHWVDGTDGTVCDPGARPARSAPRASRELRCKLAARTMETEAEAGPSEPASPQVRVDGMYCATYNVGGAAAAARVRK